MTQRHRGFEVGDPHAPNRILWIHGYTGSPDAFLATAEMLAARLNAYLSVPLLPGHGSEEHHLIGHTFNHDLDATRHFAAQLESSSAPFAIIGYSFGALVAAILASEFHPQALVLALPPYKLRFPFWLPGVELLLGMRPFWHKILNAEDLAARKGTFYYPDFPGSTIAFMKAGQSRAAKVVADISCPILTINTADDPLLKPEGGKLLLDASGHNDANESYVLAHGRHALFFPPQHDEETRLVVSFLEKHLK